MKISSKSILSPGHPRDPPSSLRLKPNRSLRGSQSPMFPSNKTRGSRPFENPEPSSPKVTCIGQVRVKARKKHGKNNNNNRNVQKNRIDGSLIQDQNRGEVSFRRVDKIQSWVHFPLTICEALSCLFPCRTPSCLSNNGRENISLGERERGERSCGAILARWLVAVEGGKREIEGGETEERETGFRRHGVGEIEVEQGMVSICVPPKNALLLMRCGRDPLRVNALANRLCECREPTEEEDDKGERETEVIRKDLIFWGEFDGYEKLRLVESGEGEDEMKAGKEIEKNVAMEARDGEKTDDLEDEKLVVDGELGDEESEDELGDELSCNLSGSVEKTENLEIGEIQKLEIWETGKLDIWETEELGMEKTVETCEVTTWKTEKLEIGETKESNIGEIEESEFEKAMELFIEETEDFDIIKSEELIIEKTDELEIEKTDELENWKTEELVVEEDLLDAEEKGEEVEERRNSRYSCSSVISLNLDVAEREIETDKPQLEEETEDENEEEDSEPVLPDCLLLMRYEPKLSMEVSKETWICSTDFIRWLPKRRPKPNKINGRDEPKKRTTTVDSDALLPPRSSCSFPAPPPTSMTSMIEQRLMNAVAYEPFVLTRCKSEPMRTVAAKLVPETCFWKNRKLEPHRSANFGVGVTGIGF